MSIYTDLRADVSDLLLELGSSVTYTRYSSTSSLASGAVTRTASATQTLRTAVVPLKMALTFDGLDLSFMDGVDATTESRFALSDTVGATFVPGPGDSASVLGKTWEVVGSTAINVDGVTDVVYVVGLTRP